MGLSSSAAVFLIREAQARPFNGAILTLGAQELSFDAVKLRAVADLHNFALRATNAGQRLTDLAFLQALGFSELVRTDVDAFEGADVIFDLNSSSPPPSLIGRFDVVLDSGTIEHVFHIPNVLANMHRFLKVGGRAIHISPSSNHADHGFYMFSPTLFYDYYEANGFRIECCKFLRYTLNIEVDPWEVGDYTPGALDHVSFGGLDSNLYMTAIVATKIEGATHDRIPQQSFYRRKAWGAAPSPPSPATAPQEPPAPPAPTPPPRSVMSKVRRELARLGRQLAGERRPARAASAVPPPAAPAPPARARLPFPIARSEFY